ncbi:MAG: hypothetical protein ABF289_03970 [Clostridiales bacterium]
MGIRIGIESILNETKKVPAIKKLDITIKLVDDIPYKFLKLYKQRISSESFSEIIKYPEHIKYALLAIFFIIRLQEILDIIVELLIQIIHKINSLATKKVAKKLIKNFKSGVTAR